MSAAALEVIEGGVVGETTALRRRFASQLNEAWHGTKAKLMQLGDLLIQARIALPSGEFAAMVANDLDFSRDHALRFMRIAADPRLRDPALKQDFPEAIEAMDTLRRLDDSQFETAIAQGAIRPDMTVKEAQQLVREFRSQQPHRPGHNQIPAPSQPAGTLSSAGATALTARTYSEMVWLLIQRRNALGLSQEALDARVCAEWTDSRIVSKLEIPHEMNGRVASPRTLAEWLQGLGVGIQIVAL